MRLKDFLIKFDFSHRKKVSMLNDFNNMDTNLFLERLRNLTHILDLGITFNKKNEFMYKKIINLLSTFEKRKLKDDGTISWVKTIIDKYESFSPKKTLKKQETNIWKLINNRSSVRIWNNKKIARNIIETIIKQGMLAPVSCNRQSWKFVVFSGKKRKILEHPLLESAPITIVIFIDTRPYFENEHFAPSLDAGYCAENITLASEALGLSTCSVYYSNKDNDFNRKCDIEEYYKPFVSIALGYSDIVPTKVLRKNIKNSIIWK